MWWIDVLGAGRGDTKDYWEMWWIDVLGTGRGDTKDYWEMWWIDVLGTGRGDTKDYWGWVRWDFGLLDYCVLHRLESSA